MIPKIIHYCWFGRAEMPEEYKQNIKEWAILNPNWEIREWNESNFEFNNEYLIVADKNQNWANISNYARLRLLHDCGGVYMDVDVKLIKPLDDLIQYECFIGFESGIPSTNTFSVNNAVIGSVSKHDFLKKSLDHFTSSFDGNEKANISAPILMTDVLIEEFGLSVYKEQLIGNIKIFEKEVFYPLPYEKAYDTNNLDFYIEDTTIAIHLWGRSWFSKKELLDRIDSQSKFIEERIEYITKLESILNDKNNKDLSSEKDSMQSASIENANVSNLPFEVTDNDKYSSTSNLSKSSINMESQACSEIDNKSSKLIYDFILSRINHIEDKFLDLAVENRLNKRLQEIDKEIIESLKLENSKINDNYRNLTKAVEENRDFIIDLERRIQGLNKDIFKSNTNISNNTSNESLKPGEGILSEKPYKSSFSNETGQPNTLDKSNATGVNSKADSDTASVRNYDIFSDSVNSNSVNQQLYEENQVLNERINKFKADLDEKTKELERAKFKVTTISSYIDNFSHIRSEYEHRINVLEDLVQKMRIKNRVKRLAGLYKNANS